MSSRTFIAAGAFLFSAQSIGAESLAVEGPLSQSAETPTGSIASSQAQPVTEGVEPAPLESISVQVGEEQPTADAESPVRPRGSLIEEIVVTAQKREEKLQDVPIAISAFSADQLAAAGIEDTRSLQLLTPGLQFSGAVGFDLIYLRGIGTDAFLPSFDPSVATYVDGIYVPAQQGNFTSLGGVERIEVLKGPQGTLFGRNSTGGAISVTTKSPGNTTEATIDTEISRFNGRKAKAYFSAPITDSLGIAVAGLYSGRDPYYQLVDTPGPLYSPHDYSLERDETKAGRVKLRWTPTDNLELSLAAFRLKSGGSSGIIQPLRRPSPLGTLLGLRAEQNDFETSADAHQTINVEQEIYYGNAIWSLDWFDIKLIGGDQKITSGPIIYDFDGSQRSLVAFNGLNAPNRIKTAELQFVSNQTSWGADWFNWVGGIYLLDQLAGYDPSVFSVAGNGTIDQSSALAGLIPGALLSQLQLGVLPVAIPTLAGPGVLLNIHGMLRTKSESAFLQTTVNFTDWLGLTLGGRYQEESRFLEKQYVAVYNSAGEETTFLQFDQPEVTQKNFSPKVSINLKPAEDILVYASFSRGFKSGSYNVVTVYTPPDYVKPEKATAYELGLKSTFLDGNLRFNAAVFQTEIDDLQQQFVSLLSGGAVSVENAGSARSRGAEADVVWVPLPQLDPGLALNGGATYLDAEYLSYQNASGYDPQTGLYNNNFDFSGNRLSRVPEWSATFGLSQAIELSDGTVTLGTDIYYNDGFFYTPQNSAQDRQDAYALLNARLSYFYTPWSVTVTAFVDNALDKVYSSASFTNDFGTETTLAPPRIYGLRVGWEF